MNRIVIAAVLGLLAIGAAGIWALGQFGGPPPMVIEAREPLVREAQEVASATPAAPAPGPTARVAAPASADPSAQDAPSPAPQAPSVNTTARDTFRTTLDEPTAQPQKAPAPAATDPPVTPQSVAPAHTPTAQPKVQAQSAQVDGLEAQFKSRRLTYNRPPEKLALDKAIDVSLIIDTSKQADVKGRLEGLPGTIVERDVDLSDTVAAELLGAAFDIQLQTTATRQKLSAKIPNEWRWRVTPKQKGTHQLTLNVYGYAVGSADAEPLDSYSDQITILVEPVDELVTWAKGVQPLFAVLAALAGIGSACFAFLRFREEKKQTKAMTSKSE